MSGTGVFYIFLGLVILLLLVYAANRQRKRGQQGNRSTEDSRNEHYMDLRSTRSTGDRRDDPPPKW